MQDILYDLDILNGLFTEKDFDFLKNSNSYEVKIDTQLQAASDKRSKIVEYISNFNDKLNKNANIDPSKAKESINIAEKAFKNINNIIVNLCNLKDNIQDIEKDILELIVEKESSYPSNDSLNNSIFEIKKKINEFDTFSNEVDKIVFSSSLVVNDFFNKCYTDNSKIQMPKSDPILKATYDAIEKKYSTHSSDHNDAEIKDNPVLRISEKDNKVYLPYSKSEILDYIKTYPNVYKTYDGVINREYVVDLTFYSKHPVLARFRETYSLIRDREMKSVVDAFKRAVDLMFRYDINPAIIAGLKSESQLDLFLDCIEKNDLESFKPFKIIFEINPI